ncbi:MAG TPA: hydantoinase B/oxoprolinase family protein, partial [Methylomirabilota bacterium]|nr:hydantoinase B/oxoprolinase family protein [Methylomirabilota bacterium]
MVDPITLQVIQARLAGIVQEMQNSLFRTGYSTIIRESQDASCALLNTQGEVIAQHVVLPLHMGAFPACAEAILKAFAPGEIGEGDAFIINHPYLGGSPHAPDMGVFTPIFYRGEWVGFAADMAHKSDIGGTVPGSDRLAHAAFGIRGKRVGGLDDRILAVAVHQFDEPALAQTGRPHLAAQIADHDRRRAAVGGDQRFDLFHRLEARHEFHRRQMEP